MSKDGHWKKVKALLGITEQTRTKFFCSSFRRSKTWSWPISTRTRSPAPLENALIVMCVSYYKAAGLGDHPGGHRIRRVREARGRHNVLRQRFRRFRIGADLQPGAEGDDFFGWRTVLNEFRRLRW